MASIRCKGQSVTREDENWVETMVQVRDEWVSHQRRDVRLFSCQTSFSRTKEELENERGFYQRRAGGLRKGVVGNQVGGPAMG